MVALALPDMMRMRASHSCPACGVGRRSSASTGPVGRLPWRIPRPGRSTRPVQRRRQRRSMGVLGDFALMEVGDPESRWQGQSLGEIADSIRRRRHRRSARHRARRWPDVVSGLAFADPVSGSIRGGLGARVSVWKDPRVMLGGSDAGAHLDLMCHANYPTVVLGEVVRRARPVVAGAGHRDDDRPAGPPLWTPRSRPGVQRATGPIWSSSIPTSLDSNPTEVMNDLPGGGERLSATARGIQRVLVRGRPVVVEGSMTDGASGPGPPLGPRHRNGDPGRHHQVTFRFRQRLRLTAVV